MSLFSTSYDDKYIRFEHLVTFNASNNNLGISPRLNGIFNEVISPDILK